MSIADSTPQQYPEPAPPLRAVRLGDDTVIPLDANLALVASTSETDVWHVVEQRRCSCAGFRYRGTCKHLALAEQALAPAGVKAGDWPEGWAGPAVLDERQLDQDLAAAADAPPADTALARIFGWTK
jgi:hypothetical protein